MSSTFRNNLILLGVLLALGALALVLEGPWSFRKGSKTSSPAVYSGSREAIDLVEITGPGGSATLRKEKGVWMAGEKGTFFPAEREAVDRALDLIPGTNGGVVVARNSASHEGYRLDDRNGIRVAISEGGRKTADFLVGGQGPDLFSSYLRRQGDSEVILVKGYLRPLFDRPLKNWRDLNLLSFPAADAVGVLVERPKGKLVLRRDGGKWKKGETSPADADGGAVDNLLSKLASLRASDASDVPASEAGFDRPSLRLAVTLKGGSARELTVGSLVPDKSASYARTPGRDTVFLVSSLTVREIGRLADVCDGLTPAPGSSSP